MDQSATALPKGIRQVLESTLRSVPLVKNLTWKEEPKTPDRGVDWLVTVDSGNRSEPIAIEVCSKGHPRQIREAINRLLLYRHHSNNPLTYLMVAAPAIGPDGAEMCRKERIGYCDLAGNCYLMFGAIFVERSGLRNSTGGPKPPSDLFSPKSERILRWLFNDPAQSWKVVPLAKQAKVSLGTVSSARKLLLEREWAKESEEGIRLIRPDALLKEWAAVWARQRKQMRSFYSRQPFEVLEKRMADFARERLTAFALTGLAGAWRMAPMVQYIRTQVYWAGNVDGFAEALDLKSVETGANVQVLAPRDEGVFYHLSVEGGVQVASSLQLYLDLQNEPTRGAEAAKHLWDTVLFPSHANSR